MKQRTYGLRMVLEAIILLVVGIAIIYTLLGVYTLLRADEIDRSDRAKVLRDIRAYPYTGEVDALYLREGDELTVYLKPNLFPSMKPWGSCDSKEECKKKIEQICKDAGHGGADEGSIEITDFADGSGDKSCSGKCSDGSGAVGIVHCKRQTLLRGLTPRPRRR